MDKAYRWEYSGRGRTYDYEGFNRLPNLEPVEGLPSFFAKPVTADEVITFQKRFAPDINGARDVAEPETLYLWDAAKRGTALPPLRRIRADAFRSRPQSDQHQPPETLSRPDADCPGFRHQTLRRPFQPDIPQLRSEHARLDDGRFLSRVQRVAGPR